MRSSPVLVARNPSPTPTPPAPTDAIRLIGATLHLSRDQEVFGEGEPADHVYKVVKGAARAFRVLSDGRRQICEFYLPGDIFGVETGPDRRTTAEAVGEAVLIVARRSALGDEGDAGAARRLWLMTMEALRRSQAHALTLGRRSAAERVAWFLADMAERLGGGEALELSMSRQDIADYLGLTIETVSRTLTQLQVSGLIRLAGCRSVQLLRPRALADLCA